MIASTSVAAFAALVVFLILAPLSEAARESRLTIAIGDLHGDADQARLLLQKIGIVDAAGHWAANTTTLIQVGDLMDQGPQETALLTFFMQLQREATRVGGNVVVMLGNHEAYNLRGDYAMVTRSVMKEQGGAARRKVYLSSGHSPGDFLRAEPLLFTRDGIAFAHGGISDEVVRMCGSVAKTNAAARALLQGSSASAAVSEGAVKTADGQLVSGACLAYIKKVLHQDEISAEAGNTNPLFMRLLPSGQGFMPVDHCREIATALAALTAERVDGEVTTLVSAHTPHGNWKRQYCRHVASAGGVAAADASPPRRKSATAVEAGEFAQFVEIDFHLSRWKGGVLGTGAVLVINSVYETAPDSNPNGTAAGAGAGAELLVDRNVALWHFVAGRSGRDAITILQHSLAAPITVVNTKPTYAASVVGSGSGGAGTTRSIADEIVVTRAKIGGMSKQLQWIIGGAILLLVLIGARALLRCCESERDREDSKHVLAAAAGTHKPYGAIDT